MFFLRAEVKKQISTFFFQVRVGFETYAAKNKSTFHTDRQVTFENSAVSLVFSNTDIHL